MGRDHKRLPAHRTGMRFEPGVGVRGGLIMSSIGYGRGLAVDQECLALGMGLAFRAGIQPIMAHRLIAGRGDVLEIPAQERIHRDRFGLGPVASSRVRVILAVPNALRRVLQAGRAQGKDVRYASCVTDRSAVEETSRSPDSGPPATSSA